MKIAFLGLGIMGSRMAANLLAAGHDLAVFNRTAAKADDLVAAGARLATSPADAAAGAEVLITMLAHPEAVEAYATGPDGFLPALPEGALWLDASTVHPNFSRRMAATAAQHKVRMLDAPVAGSKNQAANAQLIFIVGGAETDLEAARPLMDIMGNRIIHAGAQAMGTSLKIVVNHLLACTMAAFSEGVVLGEAMGISRETLMNVIPGGPVAAPFLSYKKEKILSGDYAVEFPLRWMQKDLQMATTAAYDYDVPLPAANSLKEIYQLAIREGYGDQDFSAIFAYLKGE